MRAAYFYLRVAVVVAAWLVVTLPFVLLALPLWGSRRLASWYGRTMTAVALPLLGVRLELRHGERIAASQPCVYVVNHQSNLDFLFLGAAFPPSTGVIAKREVAWIPLFGLLFVATRNILIDRHARKKAIAVLDKAVEALHERGDSIWIFPEGTRNRTGERLGAFKKGAFHMAIAAQVPVVPIVLSPIAPLVDMDAKRMPGGRSVLEVLEPVSTAGLTADDVDSLLARVREAMWRGLEAFERGGAPATEGPVPVGIEAGPDGVSS